MEVFDEDCIRVDQTYYHHDLRKYFSTDITVAANHRCSRNENLNELICGIRFLISAHFELGINNVILVIESSSSSTEYVKTLANLFPRIIFQLYCKKQPSSLCGVNTIYRGSEFKVQDSLRCGGNSAFIYHNIFCFNREKIIRWIRFLNPAMWMIDFTLGGGDDNKTVKNLDGVLSFLPYSDAGDFSLKLTSRNIFARIKVVKYDVIFLKQIVHYQNTEVNNKPDIFVNVFTKMNESYSKNSLIFNRNFQATYFLFVILRYVRFLKSEVRPKTEEQILDFALDLIYSVTTTATS